jgi:hypothetical protein
MAASWHLQTVPGVVAARFDEGDHAPPLGILGLFLLVSTEGCLLDSLGAVDERTSDGRRSGCGSRGQAWYGGEGGRVVG